MFLTWIHTLCFLSGFTICITICSWQSSLAAEAIKLAREDQVDWILHIDTDELVYPGGSPEYSLQQFLGTQPAEVDMLVFPNYESMPESSNVVRPFEEVRGRSKFRPLGRYTMPCTTDCLLGILGDWGTWKLDLRLSELVKFGKLSLGILCFALHRRLDPYMLYQSKRND